MRTRVHHEAGRRDRLEQVYFISGAESRGENLKFDKDPELLERRKKFGPAAEQNVAQRIIISIGIVGNIALLVFCALDHRFAWSPAPAYVSLVGDVVVALGFFIYFLVFKEIVTELLRSSATRSRRWSCDLDFGPLTIFSQFYMDSMS